MNKTSGNINLFALQHVKMELPSGIDKGKMVQGIFIPIEVNCLEHRKEDKVPKLNILFNTVPTPNKDQDGFIGQQGNVKWKLATDAQKEIFNNLPILGNVKEWKGTSDGVNNEASNETFTPQSDDLPF